MKTYIYIEQNMEPYIHSVFVVCQTLKGEKNRVPRDRKQEHRDGTSSP